MLLGVTSFTLYYISAWIGSLKEHTFVWTMNYYILLNSSEISVFIIRSVHIIYRLIDIFILSVHKFHHTIHIFFYILDISSLYN